MPRAITYYDVIAQREAVRTHIEVLQAALDNGIFTKKEEIGYLTISLSPKGHEASRAIINKEVRLLRQEFQVLTLLLHHEVPADDELLVQCHFPEKRLSE